MFVQDARWVMFAFLFTNCAMVFGIVLELGRMSLEMNANR